ncbi:peroxidase 29-like [Lycium ferocissimum]|uniref:peroxidase 29-like n=1 Tax=Lycium ferocissimum TaxID=112874 RepID=UPI002816961C|nr:peroxidase 29-like [Lycium ferocissimum]
MDIFGIRHHSSSTTARLELVNIFGSFAKYKMFIVGDHEEEKIPGLELNFYRNSCPNAEQFVKDEVSRSTLIDPTTAAALLRLAFHDCQVDGCDASVLLSFSNGLMTETESEMNFGLRKLHIINGIKSSLERICPQTVSCSDIIQLAARDAVHLSGGPFIDVFTGRKDGTLASKERADKELPPADISVDKFIEIFQEKNITLQEGVALIGKQSAFSASFYTTLLSFYPVSEKFTHFYIGHKNVTTEILVIWSNSDAGAHTLGIGHCRNFERRLQPPGDPTLSAGFKLTLLMICSNPFLSNITFETNDLTTFAFDNRYFTDILNGRGLLKIDSDISRDQRTKPHVLRFASDQKQFFRSFTSGFLKLSNHKVLLGKQGEIRKDCRVWSTELLVDASPMTEPP